VRHNVVLDFVCFFVSGFGGTPDPFIYQTLEKRQREKLYRDALSPPYAMARGN
jgi:hypothetical protein